MKCSVMAVLCLRARVVDATWLGFVIGCALDIWLYMWCGLDETCYRAEESSVDRVGVEAVLDLRQCLPI